MPLYDAVRVNCKNGATTEDQGAGVKYIYIYIWAKGCMLGDSVCVLSDMT